MTWSFLPSIRTTNALAYTAAEIMLVTLFANAITAATASSAETMCHEAGSRCAEEWVSPKGELLMCRFYCTPLYTCALDVLSQGNHCVMQALAAFVEEYCASTECPATSAVASPNMVNQSMAEKFGASVSDAVGYCYRVLGPR